MNNDSILVGDFNSNKIWDTKDRIANHTDVVDYLNKKGIVSLYHQQENEKQGEESKASFFMYRKLDKPYHIDYCFTSNNIINNGFEINFEDAQKWIDLSDHSPIIVEFKQLNSEQIKTISFNKFVEQKVAELSDMIKQKFQNEIENILQLSTQNGEVNHSKIHQQLSYLFQIDELISKMG